MEDQEGVMERQGLHELDRLRTEVVHRMEAVDHMGVAVHHKVVDHMEAVRHRDVAVHRVAAVDMVAEEYIPGTGAVEHTDRRIHAHGLRKVWEDEIV